MFVSGLLITWMGNQMPVQLRFQSQSCFSLGFSRRARKTSVIYFTGTEIQAITNVSKRSLDGFDRNVSVKCLSVESGVRGGLPSGSQESLNGEFLFRCYCCCCYSFIPVLPFYSTDMLSNNTTARYHLNEIVFLKHLMRGFDSH